MNTKKTGAFIAKLRKEKGITQQTLAEQLYVTAKTVSRWETGSYAPPVDIIARLSEIFDVTADEILAGECREKSTEEKIGKTAEKSSFRLNEKIDFYRKKWLHEHIAVCILIAVCLAALLVFSVLKQWFWVSGIVVVCSGIIYLIIRNRLMAYIERNAYDGSGDFSEDSKQ
ncbi:MAG: helix-turn-helix domain-containing protein [Oscillospiraceae bacterium]